jgi:hypothetical protein
LRIWRMHTPFSVLHNYVRGPFFTLPFTHVEAF